MTVTTRLNADTTALENAETYLSQIELNAQRLARFVFTTRIQRDFLDDLQFYPPVPPNSRYRRTGRLKRGWVVDLELTENGFRLIVTNQVRYTQWVVGSLAQNRSAAARFQQHYHKRNGWVLARDTVEFWFNAFLEEFERQLDNDFESIAFNRRGSTTRIV